jgi:hypothetical protein
LFSTLWILGALGVSTKYRKRQGSTWSSLGYFAKKFTELHTITQGLPFITVWQFCQAFLVELCPFLSIKLSIKIPLSLHTLCSCSKQFAVPYVVGCGVLCVLPAGGPARSALPANCVDFVSAKMLNLKKIRLDPPFGSNIGESHDSVLCVHDLANQQAKAA